MNSFPSFSSAPATRDLSGRRRFLQTSTLAGAAYGTGLLAAAGAEVPLAPPDKQAAGLKIPDPPARKVGWAIVGLGQLAVEEILPAFAECRLSEVTALVSGHRDKALKLAGVHQVKPENIYDYANFDSIADNDQIQVVYIVLPNSMHAEYTIRALKAGKHVLCEKPMASSAKEAAEMIAAAAKAKRKLMVGYRLHGEPLNMRVMEMCAKKTLGKIKTFASSNCQQVKAPNIRLSAKLAGGPVGDVGIYSINAARYVTGEEPVEVFATAFRPSDDPRFREVDESVAFTLRFPSGILAHCDCSFGASESRTYHVHCDKGVIQMDPAFSYRGLRLFVREGSKEDPNPKETEVLLEAVNHFTAEVDHFSECIQKDKASRTPGEEGLSDMRVIEAIYASIKSGRPEKVAAGVS